MKVSELIRHLQFIESTTPDLNVHVINHTHGLPEANQVQVVHQMNYVNGHKGKDQMFVRIDAV
jgi:hypothetical protein